SDSKKLAVPSRAEIISGGQLQPGSYNANGLADVLARSVQFVDIDRHVVELHADIVAQVPVEAEGPDFLFPAANAAQECARACGLRRAGTPVQVEIAEARSNFESSPGPVAERKWPCDGGIGEGCKAVVERERLIGPPFV